MTKIEIGKNIKQIREIKKISNYILEKNTNIDHSLLYRYESGKTEPSITNLIKLADYYNISLDELVGRDYF